MKIALAQLNYTIGDIDGNKTKIISAIEEAKKKNSDLIVFSELSICGYDPQDIFENMEFIEHCNRAVIDIASFCTDRIAVVIGCPTINKNDKGKKLYNSALFLSEGAVSFIQSKSLLPTYDVFGDYRYFEPNREFKLFEYKGVKIGITICEDIWNEQNFKNKFLSSSPYILNPIDELMKLSPDLILNISGSPFMNDKAHQRKYLIKTISQKCQIPIVYVNQVGANTELIFDGGSMVSNNKGEIVLQSNYFSEEINYISFEEINSLKAIENKNISTIEKIHTALVLGISDFFKKMNFKSATLGLSGGIDSAVTLALLVEAIGKDNVRVFLMPSQYSSDHSITDSVEMAEKLGIQYDTIKIEPIYSSFVKQLDAVFAGYKPDLTEENLQARIRGTLLMAISNKKGNILVNTSNKSELAVGYSTLYGDSNGAMSIIGDVYKTQVYKLAVFINRNKEIIPQNIIDKAPSAELRPNQKDSDSLPEYDLLDKILFKFLEEQKGKQQIVDELKISESLVSEILSKIHKAEFKRFQFPPVLKVSSKSFGSGRRIPIVSQFYL